MKTRQTVRLVNNKTGEEWLEYACDCCGGPGGYREGAKHVPDYIRCEDCDELAREVSEQYRYGDLMGGL